MAENTSKTQSAVDADYCTTRQAAEMIGLSLGTVRQMIESGELSAWKTAGGHRRVSVASVNDYLRRRGSAPLAARDPSRQLSVLIAEDDPDLQRLYQLNIAAWRLPISVQMVSNGFEGLVQIGQQAPDVLILDLLMPGMDGFEMIRTLRANPALAHMDIIVVTGMDPARIAERGGLPADITLCGKPVPFHQLHGFMQARLVTQQRSLPRAF
jgi:excisionase family DNA binding protein